MREIRFRQRIQDGWYYWGFMKEEGDLIFQGITTGNISTIEEALKNSQQFTGLHDKAGKEIWESDLYALDGGIYQIVWNPAWAGFFRKVITPSDYEPLGDPLQPLHDRQGGEVVGNIFEGERK